ncbi:hypothetical protein LCGC14_2228220 [marine sediment metagenome]|uniref:Acyltransferase 3 domain-containing protein n=1 Tax=marine sediment metagenome TaxID=412755 RepID=A0A0F9FLI6_9ZZZZ
MYTITFLKMITIQMNEIEENKIHTHEKNNHYFAIDLLKALMIFLVVFDHTYPWKLKNSMGVQLWERISIPIFLVLMGFNMGLSFKKTGETSLKKLYTRLYFKKKFWRYIFPFLVAYLLSTFIGLAINDFDTDVLDQYQREWSFPHLFLGILPFWGPGNWFLPVIFWSILIMPLLYKGFSGKPKWRIITLILCFVIEIALHLTVFFVFDPLNVPTPSPEHDTLIFYYNFITTSPFFMLSGLGLGIWFSKNHDIFAKQNIFMWTLFGVSFFYLIISQFLSFRFAFIFGDYHLFVFPYSAFLFLIAMKLIPKNPSNLFVKGIKLISKSTYHILLTQIIYFAIVINIWGDHYGASIFGINPLYNPFVVFLYVFINWVICIPIGILWWYGETKLREYRLKRKSLKFFFFNPKSSI